MEEIVEIKTPISYYGGKQNMVRHILPLIPLHNLYCEPFVGGGAVYWKKEPSKVEVINDTNKSLITFYKVLKERFIDLETKIKISLHSREMHRKATVIYDNPDMFSDIDIAWAVWVKSSQSFASKLNGHWGYDRLKGSQPKKIQNKKEQFTPELAIRLQNTQIECTDALRIIRAYDTPEAFFYVDPPYFNSNCGHYDGYTIEDFEMLLKQLSKIEGKFLLSSYPSDILKQYVIANGWHTKAIEQKISVNNKSGKTKAKTEMLTANYVLEGIM